MEKYKITFIKKAEGAIEETLVVNEPWLVTQINILTESGYKIIKVTLKKEAL